MTRSRPQPGPPMPQTPRQISDSVLLSAWVLADHVHATDVDGDLVFLDVAADAYYCLPGATAQVEIASNGWSVAIEDEMLAAELQQANLVRPLAAGFNRPDRTRPNPPQASAIRYEHPRPRPGDIQAVITTTLDVALNYRGRPFHEIIDRTSAASRRGRPPRRDLLEVVDGFHRWIPFAPLSGKCLLRAFALLRLLQREGHSASWVFGVSTWPFQAHCWLQVGELVLDDTCERVAAYRPILVV